MLLALWGAFREVAGVPAWLVNVYFVDDPHSPTSRAEWEAALAGIKAQLGLGGISVPHDVNLFLEAGADVSSAANSLYTENACACPMRPCCRWPPLGPSTYMNSRNE
jgi:hypothetical protein